MAQTTISVRMDDQLKASFEKTCNELGLSMSTAIIMLAKKITREQRIPFEVSIDPFYSQKNIQALHESIEQMRSGKTIVKTIDELEKMADE